MLSIAKQKLIASLSQKKLRNRAGLFLAEGSKLITDLLAADVDCVLLVATKEWLGQYPQCKAEEQVEVTDKELQKLSNQTTPQGALAVFRQPVADFSFAELQNCLSLALDEVQDPGNMGTIIRVADWFGVQHVFCSETSADVFSPKTVQATMGALARVKVHRVSLPDFLLAAKEHHIDIYGTFLDGEDMYQKTLAPCGIVVMGNEGNGISPQVGAVVAHRLRIPSFPANVTTSESLNVSVATAIVCAEFRRTIKN